MSKNLYEMVGLQSEKRKGQVREARGERLQGTAEATGNASRQGNSSAASFPKETSVRDQL